MSTTHRSERIGPEDRDGLPPAWTFEARGSNERWTFGGEVRPWNWVELGRDDARTAWEVLGSFVEYFNARYVERAEQRIPPCWPEHGALVEEITTLVFARWHAFASEHASIGGAQYWHQYSVPGFLERMGRWLGPDRLERCQQGLHEDARDTEPANEGQWLSRRHSIIDLDGDLRREVAGMVDPGDHDPGSNAPQIAFLDKQRSREQDGNEPRARDHVGGVGVRP